MRGRIILVTGGSGFIPSRLTRRLLDEGAKVAITTKYNSVIDNQRLKDVWGDIEVIETDIRNQDSLKQIAVLKPEIIVHTAAYNHVGDSFIHVSEAFDVNAKGTINVLEAYNGYEKFVYASSSEVYGFQTDVPFTESMLPRPISPYAIGKYAGELYCQMKMTMMNSPIVVLRLFNTYGPFQSSRAVIAEMIEKMLSDKPIHATEGVQTREFNFVDDIVDGFVRAIKKDEAVGNIINLGNGQEIPIAELITKLKEITGSRSELHIGSMPHRPTEIWRMFADNRRAREILRWKARTTFEDGLKKTIDWYRDYFRAPSSGAVSVMQSSTSYHS